MDAATPSMSFESAPLFSIIVPAYNVENYLERCIESICSQKGSFEVIIVDDGATDTTGKIADSLAAHDERIRVYHTENRGLGAARNFGLARAAGQYVWFIDSDDWIEPRALTKMTTLIREYDPQIFFCNYCTVYENGYAVLNVMPGDFADELIVPAKLSNEDFLALFAWRAHAWQIIAKRTYLDDNAFRFPEATLYEDHLFALQTLLNSNSVYVSQAPFYNYFQREGSISTSRNKNITDFINVSREALSYLKESHFLERLPGLHALYTLPLVFYMVHVPEDRRKEFLDGLKKNLELFPLDGRGLTLEERLFKGAVTQGSPLLARLAAKVHGAAACKLSLIFTSPRVFFKKGLKKIFYCAKRRLFELKNTGPEGMVSGPGSAGCLNAAIEARVTQKNVPYVLAEDGADLRAHVVFERGIGQLRLGRRASVGSGTTLVISQPEGIEIGPQVMVSWGCTIMDGNMHSLDWEERIDDGWHWYLSEQKGLPGLGKCWANVESRPIRIGANAWIGCNSIVLGGVTIGRGAIVGAGSVVDRDVPPYCIYAGNRARFVRLAPGRRDWRPEDVETARRAGLPAEVMAQISAELAGE